MEIYIFNREIELQGILDRFDSLLWNRKYFKPGDFELHCSLNDKSIQLLKEGNIVYKDNGSEAGYITSKQLYKDVEGKEVIRVKGSFLTNYLSQRINWGRINFNGKTELLIRQLITDNAISPSNIDRKINNLVLGDLKNFIDIIQYQNSFGNIIECLENISNTSNIGYRSIFDIQEKKIIFDLYKGVDRSINNGVRAPCIFSRDFENILEQEYTESVNDYKNTCLIAGSGEAEERRLTSIEVGQGIDRYELFVDARDLEDTKDEVRMSDFEYFPILKQRGNEKLKEHDKIKTFDSKVDTAGNNIYKKDYNLGDIITKEDYKWNLTIDTRITGIEEVYEEKGMEIYATFGNDIPNILDKLRQVVK